ALFYPDKDFCQEKSVVLLDTDFYYIYKDLYLKFVVNFCSIFSKIFRRKKLMLITPRLKCNKKNIKGNHVQYNKTGKD
ncbi:MAG: hypothetical protein ABIL20_07945, partial [candidate division WOR-3 bacterium]